LSNSYYIYIILGILEAYGWGFCILKMFWADVGKKTILTTFQLKQSLNDTFIDYRLG